MDNRRLRRIEKALIPKDRGRYVLILDNNVTIDCGRQRMTLEEYEKEKRDTDNVVRIVRGG